MNAHSSKIEPATLASEQDFNLTRLILRNDIVAIKRWVAGRFSVELQDGRFGVGGSVGEALERAQAGAVSLRRIA